MWSVSVHILSKYYREFVLSSNICFRTHIRTHAQTKWLFCHWCIAFSIPTSILSYTNPKQIPSHERSGHKLTVVPVLMQMQLVCLDLLLPGMRVGQTEGWFQSSWMSCGPTFLFDTEYFCRYVWAPKLLSSIFCINTCTFHPWRGRNAFIRIWVTQQPLHA
jgi:hypothetical protein